MREWIYKRDEKGRPRRFLSHREAILWAARKVGGFAGSAIGFGVAALIFGPGRENRGFVLWLAGIVLVICAAVVIAMYAYVALAGGLMGSDERRGYLEELGESRRGRW